VAAMVVVQVQGRRWWLTPVVDDVVK